ncbi:MAG: nitrate reductase [Gammaproteobacteria bacterium]|nr:nitrate reductase [Gammaproteobacteria bacterium]
MSFLSYLYAGLFYCAAMVMVVGVGRKVMVYTRIPAPLKIPTTPAPTTRFGVVGRMLREVVFFESLFKSSKWTWLFGWAFHFGLLLALIRHLRYFTEPVWSWVAFLQSAGIYGGYAMVFGLLGLWGRRFFVDRVRYISAPSDHLMLALILAIAGSGLLMKYVWHTDVVALKAFALGLLWFNWAPLPSDPILLIHLGLVICLMFVFPISKLLHVPGLFFSPTRNQVDDSREQRHAPTSV